MKSLSSVVCIAAVVALPGCGEQSDEDRVRSTAEDFASAFADGDYETACSMLTREAKARLLRAGRILGPRGDTCEEVAKAGYGLLSSDLKEKLENYEVESVRFRGDTATISDNTGVRSRLRRQGDDWLVEPAIDRWRR